MAPQALLRYAPFALAAALVGVLVAFVELRFGLAITATIGVLLGLVIFDNLRNRQRWVLDQLTRQSEQTRRVVKEVDRHRAQDFHQVQALLNLHAMVNVQHRLPAARTAWSATPEVLLLLISQVQQLRPRLIVDLGSGVSTVWLAMALRDHGIEAKVISVDHDPEFAEQTRAALVAADLDKFAEVRVAELVEVELDGETYPWYDRTALADIEQCDLLFVDGPPGLLRAQARFPALPLLTPMLSPAAVVIVDDYARPDETEMVARWLTADPAWSMRPLPFEKGAAMLVRAG